MGKRSRDLLGFRGPVTNYELPCEPRSDPSVALEQVESHLVRLYGSAFTAQLPHNGRASRIERVAQKEWHTVHERSRHLGQDTKDPKGNLGTEQMPVLPRYTEAKRVTSLLSDW